MSVPSGRPFKKSQFTYLALSAEWLISGLTPPPYPVKTPGERSAVRCFRQIKGNMTAANLRSKHSLNISAQPFEFLISPRDYIAN